MDSEIAKIQKQAIVEIAEHTKRSYWLSGMLVDQGRCWDTQLVEIDPIDGWKRWTSRPICLGTEDEIVPILKGKKPIPECMDPIRIAMLESILEADQDGGTKGKLGTTRLQRGSYVRAVGRRQKGARRLEAREGLSRRKAHHKKQGLSG